MSITCMAMKNHFHIKSWALNLVLMQRSGGTRKCLNQSLSITTFPSGILCVVWRLGRGEKENALATMEREKSGLEPPTFRPFPSCNARLLFNSPLSIYYNSSMTPRLQEQNCKFLTTPLSRNFQKRLEHKENQTKYRNMTGKPQSHVRTFIYRTWVIVVFIFIRISCASLERGASSLSMVITWSLPHRRHLSQPTQSMMRETFLKWSLNSSWNCEN